MYSFYVSVKTLLAGGLPSLFLPFFAYAWSVWIVKFALASRYRPTGGGERLEATVIVPVYNEDPELFEDVLWSISSNEPAELIVVVDGGDPTLAEIAYRAGATVRRIEKAGKRLAIRHGLAASSLPTEVVVIVDSDTVWEEGMLNELLAPFSDPRVGGVTPRQSIFDRDANRVRTLADWIEDLRYTLTVPAQSVFGQVGCLAGRTIAYRREAFEMAVDALVAQSVLGLPMEIGDDRVLTNELLRRGWRTVYQSSARVWTDAPNAWSTFWKQQLRWARSSQRETILSLTWLWRKPVALLCFLTDIATPFFLFAVIAAALVRTAFGTGLAIDVALWAQVLLAYLGAVASIGIRQWPHLIRFPRDTLLLPVFVLQLTFFMVPTRIIGFATCLHQSWQTRG